jgi:hypothetical protein
MSKASKDAAVVITKDHRFRPSRRCNGPSAKEKARHARQIGEVALAWNAAHAKLFQLYVWIAHDGDWPLGAAVWHTLQNDTGQRAMLEAAVRAKADLGQSYRVGILWAASILNGLTTHRNEIVHSEVLFLPNSVVPGVAVRPQFEERMTALPVEKKWRLLSGDLHALANYLEIVWFSLWMGMPRPLMRRPRLQFSRSKTASSQERRGRAKKAARERQRRSSPE